MRLSELAWPDLAERVAAGAILAVPLGSTEQHGPHLPLSTDTDIAVALCGYLAAARPDVLIAPAVPYGSSGEHSGFAGTLSIGQDATELLVLELGRSATRTFQHVLFVSTHGGNARPVGRAVARLRARNRDVSLFQPAWDGDAHAGHQETAVQLVLQPDTVHMEHAEPGDRRPLTALMPLLRSAGVRAVSPNGVLGDPTTATAEAGGVLLTEWGAELVRHVDAWCPP
jgi:creatinine amidohydrolase